MRNPYSPGAGNPPPALVGRDADLETFDIAVRRLSIGNHACSVVLTGLRGVGKTVLLGEFGRISEGQQWVHEQLEVSEETQFVSVAAELVRRAILRLSPGRRLRAGLAQAALRALRSFQVRWGVPGGGELSVGLEPEVGTADSGLLDRDLTDLFVATGKLAQQQERGVLLTIDEMQFLGNEHLTSLIVGLHRVSQLGLPFVVAGAGLPSLPALAGEARSYAERLFDFRTVDRLDDAASAAALAEPAKAEGVQWNSDALARIKELTDGYPYFLQEFGKQAWLAAESDDAISVEDVEASIPLAINELDNGFFRARFDRTTDAERAYMYAMASLEVGAGDYASGEVAAAQGKNTTQVAQVRDSLIRKGLCYSPRHGVISFTVPMFDQYLRRRLRTP